MPFQMIDEPIQVRQILNDAAGKTSEVVIWTQGQRHLFRTWMSPESTSREFRVFLPDKKSVPQISRAMAAIEKGDPSFVQVTVRGHSIFAIRAKYLGMTGNLVRFEVPKQGAMLQRRKHRRWVIPGAYELFFDTRDPVYPKKRFKGRLLDLSVDGFSFLATGRAGMSFRAGFLLRGSAITIRRKNLYIDGVVRSARPFEGGANHRQVGVKIMRIQEEDREFLNHYLAEQFIQYGGKEAAQYARRLVKRED